MSPRNRALILLLALVLITTTAALTHGFGLLRSHDNNTLTLSGNVDIRQVDLGFRVMGRITATPFEEGAHITADAILARLDPAPYEAAAATTHSQLAVATAELLKIEAEVVRTYAQLRASQASLAAARQHAEAQNGIAQLTHQRFEAGESSNLDDARAESQARATAATVSGFDASLHAAAYELALLTGRPPDSLTNLTLEPVPVPLPRKERPPRFRKQEKITIGYVESLSNELMRRTNDSRFKGALTAEARQSRPISRAQYLLGHVYDVSWILLP